MKKLWNWLKTNKAKVSGVLNLVVVYLSSENYLNLSQTVLIMGVLTTLGLISTKDSNKHSTTEQVTKSTVKKRKIGS
jgi:hypothetical protein